MAQTLTNTQLEILNAFSFNLSKEELVEFKNMIANFFAEKAIKEADKVWEIENWNNEKVNKMLTTKMRSSKNK